MNDELAARHRALTLRLAGRPVKAVCAAVGRSEVWFHKWWGRYLQAGPEGLYDLTRPTTRSPNASPPNWRGPSSPSDAGYRLTPRRPPATA